MGNEKKETKSVERVTAINDGSVHQNYSGNDSTVKSEEEMRNCSHPQNEVKCHNLEGVEQNDHVAPEADIKAGKMLADGSNSNRKNIYPSGHHGSIDPSIQELPYLILSEKKSSAALDPQSCSKTHLKLVDKAHEDSVLEEARIIEAKRKRIAELSGGTVPSEIHRKSHWDFVLEEMAWLANDFAQERLWKMTAASQICRRAAFTSRLRVEEQHQHLKLKKVAYSLAKAVMQFWHSAEVYLSNNCQNFGLKNAKHESIIFDGNEFSVNKFGEIDKAVCKELEIQKPVKNIAHAIRGYALRFLKYNSSPVPSLQEEVPVTPERIADLGMMDISEYDHLTEESLFFAVSSAAMALYRLSIESHIMQSEKTHNSMQEEVDTSMYDTPADFGCHDNAYDDEDGETSAYYMHGVFEGSKQGKHDQKKWKNFTKSPSARSYDLGTDSPYGHRGTGPQQNVLKGKRPANNLNIGSIPTKRMRTASRQRFISPFTAGITGVLPQAPMKTDASSGDTNSFQDDQSTLHGGSQIQKSVEVESAADFERQLPYDYAETSAKPKNKKKAKHLGSAYEQGWQLDSTVHNDQMSADDFIRNNRGIDDGKDLPEQYLRFLFERISKKEIKMKEYDLALQQKQPLNSNRVLGLDSILNIVIRKWSEEKHIETSDDLIRHMQEQFKEQARKSESVYYAATDVVILRFMIEVCWAPMLAAFSVPLDQSDDEVVIALCLEGIRYAIHVTAVMSMKTHRDAFVTSLAKFTSLHAPADIKQKNIDAIKAILTIADEDGNYLQEAWEHILTCVSRFEHLHLLGEGRPPAATFFAFPQNDSEKLKQSKSTILPVLKKKGPGRMQYAAASVLRGSYDSAGIAGNTVGSVTSEQMNNLVSNLNMLEQVGSSEMNRIFTQSQKLNSEAIIDFVKALSKVSMEELQSASDPRVFSLTKLVEIANYNMNRIRLVWSSIWHVLSDFFVTIGCSENLSVAIFAMDSLRQLSMQFLDREELANYNFQNEFMKPFVIVMRRSNAVEIRELIIRCVSHIVLSRVNNVKSGWKSMFMVFTTAAYDDHKNIVLLAFEIIEKIIKQYFPYITETETTTFTDCVNCLIAFTNSRFNKDTSLNAIAFLQFCATKLAERDLGSSSRNKDKEVSIKISSPSPLTGKDGKQENGETKDKEDHLYFWFPLLAGLSELSFDPRPEIRKSALQVLFETLRNHGHLFSLSLWERVFESVLFPIFDYVRHAIDPTGGYSPEQGIDGDMGELDQDAWLYGTCTLALQLVVDLFVKFYNTVNPLLRKVLLLLVSFIRRPHQSLAGIGIAAFVRLMSNAGDLFSEEKWLEVVLSLKEAANATLPDFSYIVSGESLAIAHEQNNGETAESDMPKDESERLVTHRLYASISDVKCRAAVQLLLIQAVMEIYSMYRSHLSAKSALVLFDALHEVASHAHSINTNTTLRSKLQELGSMTQMQDPPLLRLETESYQICLTFLQNLILDRPPTFDEAEVESCLVNLCEEVLQFYIVTACSGQTPETFTSGQCQWLIPLGSGKQRELAARAPLIVATLQAIGSLGDSSFEKNLPHLFPLLSSLISCEHGSNDVQVALSDMLSSSVGSVLLRSC